MEKILRTMLYVPANNWRMINSACNEGEDAVILDLEDGCPAAEKETARIFARDSVGMLRDAQIHIFVRVNALETELTRQDLSYVVTLGLDGVVLPKAESAEEIRALDRFLDEEEKNKGIAPGMIGVIPLIESPKGVLAVSDITSASKRVVAVSFGAGDYSREIGAGMGVTKLSPDDYFLMALPPRSAIAMAARAAGVLAIDAPYFGLVIDTEGLIKETQKVKLLGFTGKQLIHPRHVEPVNQVFSPEPADVALAQNVIQAYEQARAKGLGAAALNGRMIDYGSYRRAANLLSQHEKIAARRTATAN